MGGVLLLLVVAFGSVACDGDDEAEDYASELSALAANVGWMLADPSQASNAYDQVCGEVIGRVGEVVNSASGHGSPGELVAFAWLDVFSACLVIEDVLPWYEVVDGRISRDVLLGSWDERTAHGQRSLHRACTHLDAFSLVTGDSPDVPLAC